MVDVVFVLKNPVNELPPVIAFWLIIKLWWKLLLYSVCRYAV